MRIKRKKKTQDEIAFDIAASTFEKIPPVFDMEFAGLRYPTKWDESMNTVLTQELERFNTLNEVIKDSLMSFKLAVKGEVVMTSALEALGNSLFFSKIPSIWDAASYPSLKPLAAYVADFLRRLEFLDDWLNDKPPPTFWISGFYFTQAFLTGQLQNFSRRHTEPIDNVGFDFNVLENSWEAYPTGPDDGAFVYGLYFDGAQWDAPNNTVADPEPKILFSVCPAIHLQPKRSQDILDFPSYHAPCYKTSERRGMLSTTGHSTNFVMFLEIPSNLPNDFWTKRGVALLTQLD